MSIYCRAAVLLIVYAFFIPAVTQGVKESRGAALTVPPCPLSERSAARLHSLIGEYRRKKSIKRSLSDLCRVSPFWRYLKLDNASLLSNFSRACSFTLSGLYSVIQLMEIFAIFVPGVYSYTHTHCIILK